MTNAQKRFEQTIKDIPRRLTEELIVKKLKAAGVRKASQIAPKLLEHALSDSKEPFVRDDDNISDEINISITSEDIVQLDRAFNEFSQSGIPTIIQNVSDNAAVDLLASLKSNWPEQFDWERSQIASFRNNLEHRWGKGLSLLRMLLTICREIGQENLKRHQRLRPKKHSHLKVVLVRLHARACQVSDEIITLLEAGFADGAMARWRTLYEISVVATVIADHGEEIAEQYIAHEIVEAKSAMDEYARCSVLLGYKPISRREAKTIASDHGKILAKYGKEFGSPYGWAARHLKKKKPIFSDLEAAAGRAATRSYYKMASYNVHASAKGIFFKLSLLDATGIIAGASNAGLTDPAQNTAISLTSITALLFGPRWTLDKIIQLKSISILRDEIPQAFYDAERKLRRDDARYRKTR